MPDQIQEYVLELETRLVSAASANQVSGIISEVESHLRDSAEDLVKCGASLAEAETQALANFGPVVEVVASLSAVTADSRRWTRYAFLALLSLCVPCAVYAAVTAGELLTMPPQLLVMGGISCAAYGFFSHRARSIPLAAHLLAVSIAGMLAAVAIGTIFLPQTHHGLQITRTEAAQLQRELEVEARNYARGIAFLESGDQLANGGRSEYRALRPSEGSFIAPKFVVQSGAIQVRVVEVKSQVVAARLWKAGLSRLAALRFAEERARSESLSLRSGLNAPWVQSVERALPLVRDLLCVGILVVLLVQTHLIIARWVDESGLLRHRAPKRS
jgi:hypothetical protein